MRLVQRPAAAAGLTALTLALAAAGCGGDGQPSQARDDYLPGNPRAGAGGALTQVPEANCTHWSAGSPRQRERVIEQITAFFERRSEAAGGGHTLPEDKAWDSIDQACSQPYAREWKLWKIYERALAFQYEPLD